jgi:hypothetical protein
MPAAMLSTGPDRDKVKAAALLLCALVAAACRPDASTARGTAERFLDAHFVHIDLPAARALTTGVARHKVEQEMELTHGQAIDETTRKPTVRYRLLEERPDGDGASFVFLGSIRVEDDDSFERRWLVTVRPDGAGWRVSNWQETDG